MFMFETEEEFVDEVCRKLRLTAIEYGHDKLKNAVIIGPVFPERNHISDIEYIYCPTLSEVKLAGSVNFKVSRFFEDA